MPQPEISSRKPLVVRFADGRRYDLIDDSTSDTLLNAVFLRFYALAFLAWAMVGHPLPFQPDVDGTQIFALLAVSGVAGLIWLFAALSLARIAHRFLGLRSVYTPFLTLPAVVIGPLLTMFFAEQVNVPIATTDVDWLSTMAKASVVILVLDIFFGSYVAPFHSSLREIGGPAPLPPAPHASARNEPIFPDPGGDLILPRDDVIDIPALRPMLPDRASPPKMADAETESTPEVLIGTERFGAAELVLLRSDDHYINVVTRNRRALLRGRLSDTLQQIPPSSGIQINRSAWVAFAAITAVEGDDPKQQLVVKLVTGEEERVAQSRRHALLAAMALRRQDES